MVRMKSGDNRSDKSRKDSRKSADGSREMGAGRTRLDAQIDAHQRGQVIQEMDQLVKRPIALAEDVRQDSVRSLNQVLADTMTLRDLYKKHHWQVSGPTFYSLHLLFDKHYEEQLELIDLVAERIQILGGIAVAMGPDVAEMTRIERPPAGSEEVPVQLSRLLEAHEIIMKEARDAAELAADNGDDGTNDILISNVVRTNEMESWFIGEHLVNMPMTQAE